MRTETEQGPRTEQTRGQRRMSELELAADDDAEHVAAHGILDEGFARPRAPLVGGTME